MQTIPLKCSACGYKLRYNKDENKYHCDACDSDFLIDPESNGWKNFVIVAKKLEKYVGSSRFVVLPDDLLIIGKNAFENAETIESLVIPEGVYKIEENAFRGCRGLKYIVLPTTLREIGSFAFFESGLKEIDLPDSLEIIGKEAFAGCAQLTKAFLPNKDICYQKTFKNCLRLSEVKADLCRFCASFYPTGEAAKKGDPRSTLFDAFQATPFYVSLKETYQRRECIVCHSKIDYRNTCPNCGLKYINRVSGGCYIATAVYGSYDCPEVWTLRRYRDETLAKKKTGRLFIRYYYRWSPRFVQRFGHHTLFRKLAKRILDRKVKRLNEKGVSSSTYSDP